MKEVLADIDRWQEENEAVALATVIETWGSAPRKVAAKMALTASGRIAGSVSGGCVEGAVVEAGQEALTTGQARLLHFGVADETAWSVGLACGGKINVFVEPLHAATYQTWHQILDGDIAAAAVTLIAGPETRLGQKLIVWDDGSTTGSLGEEWDERGIAAAQDALNTGQSGVTQLGAGVQAFVEVNLPVPTLIMVGGVHIAIALAHYAKILGYRTIIIDPRRAFGSDERFPHVDQLVAKWPTPAFADLPPINRSTAVALLTHDPKIDDPALHIVLPAKAFYIGALGSKKTHAKRVQRLQEAGIPQEQIDRLYAPIGLDIGAETPEEIALAVMAQIIAARHQRPRGEI